MLIYVRLSEALKAKADDLVSRGHYSDLSAVFAVALENLILAEQEHSGPPNLLMPRAREEKETTASTAPAAASKPSKDKASVAPARVSETPRPSIFNWTEPPALSERLIVPLPADLFRPGQQVPVERWIFGQQNRALPAKVNSRLFISLVAQARVELEIFEAASAISSQAAAIFT